MRESKVTSPGSALPHMTLEHIAPAALETVLGGFSRGAAGGEEFALVHQHV